MTSILWRHHTRRIIWHSCKHSHLVPQTHQASGHFAHTYACCADLWWIITGNNQNFLAHASIPPSHNNLPIYLQRALLVFVPKSLEEMLYLPPTSRILGSFNFTCSITESYI